MCDVWCSGTTICTPLSMCIDRTGVDSTVYIDVLDRL